MKSLIAKTTLILTAIPMGVGAVTFGPGNETTPPVVTNVTSVQDFYDMVQVAARWLVTFGIIIGAVFVIVGGIQYMTAGGSEDGIKAAKAKIIGGLIGIAIILLAFSLVNIVGSFFTGSTVITP